MRRNLSYVVIVAALFVVGAVGAWLYLRNIPQAATPAAESLPAREDGRPSEHGRSVTIPQNPTLCSQHGIPEVVCPFCDPGLIEELGHCGGHDVPEALCTRCNPVLIAAFKAEGDWCSPHGLPESQCLICQGPEGG
ncbi:MAG: hypothetical protein ACYS0D_13500 [Planctomycetota bacterium]|jgi:hypothetical protein